MRNITKRFFTTILVLAMVFGTNTIAFAAEEVTDIAQKTAQSIDDKGRYQIEIEVVGEDETEQHDEVVIMIDGSYSLNNKWTIARNAILEIGNSIFEGTENTVITVMTFGMGDNVVVEHVETAADLEAALTDLPGGLLYGRSSTNCESGFTGIEEYINNHDNTLKDVSVVFITDGGINTDETEYAFYNWTSNTWLKKDPVTLAKYALAEGLELYENEEVILSDAYITTFGETIYTSEEVNNISDEEVMNWAACVWDNVYEYSGLNPESEYTVSDAERAFVKYDKEKGTHIQEMFYYALWGRTYSNLESRTINAGVKLAEQEKVEHLYLVDCDTATAWMQNIANSEENTSFYEAGELSNLIETLQNVISNIIYTPYNDAIIIDYMSKWVTLDESTIKVVDNNKEETIWTSADGWLITEGRPTEKDAAVIVTEVSSDEYAEGGSDVVSNTHGTIYKLEWFVKDGALVRSDNYSLVYEVDVDTAEKGFVYGKQYPANGNTTITYNDMDNNEVTKNIDVPNVVVKKTTCGQKPENKPSCGQKPEQDNNSGCNQKPSQGNNSGCNQKPNQNINNGCGQKPEQGNNSGCGQKPSQGSNIGCGQKPEQGSNSGCNQKPNQGNNSNCNQKPSQNINNGCGQKPQQGNNSECSQKPSQGNKVLVNKQCN